MSSPIRSKRPTPTERRALILGAAADVFFEQGFSAASIDMIIDRIGGSKRTIYNEFGNKEALFTALVTELADDALSAFDKRDGDHCDSLRETLLQLAQDLLVIYTSKNLLGIYRAIITEALRFPQLARSIYDKGPGRAAEELKTVLDSALARGEIRSIDTKVAADHFVGMMRDNLHLQLVLGLRGPPEKGELQQRARSAVELFLDGIAARSPRKRKAAAKSPPRRVEEPRRIPGRAKPN